MNPEEYYGFVANAGWESVELCRHERNTCLDEVARSVTLPTAAAFGAARTVALVIARVDGVGIANPFLYRAKGRARTEEIMLDQV